MQAPRGFTLIELLVVIAIIGVLSSVVLSSLNIARNRANDAHRRSDVGQLVRAINNQYTNTGALPWSQGDCAAISNNTAPPGGLAAAFAAEVIPAYISQVPLDPIRGGGAGDYLYYNRNENNGAFTVCAILEQDPGTPEPTDMGPGNCSGWAAYNHCVSQ